MHSWRICDGVGWRPGLARVLIISLTQSALAGDERHSPEAEPRRCAIRDDAAGGSVSRGGEHHRVIHPEPARAA